MGPALNFFDPARMSDNGPVASSSRLETLGKPSMSNVKGVDSHDKHGGKSRKKRLTNAPLSAADEHRLKTPSDRGSVPTRNIDGTQRQQSDAPASGLTSTTIVRNPRRGIYPASELLHHKDAQVYDQEFGYLESVSIIRFPPDIAMLLRQRLAANYAEIDAALASESPGVDDGRFFRRTEGFSGGLSTLANEGDLGLTITPTPDEDYRRFHITVEKELGDSSSKIYLTGLLLELPCLLEAYKSLEGELLFKCNDISQILYVYHEEEEPPFDIQKKASDFWEWRSGLTPGTHRIRPRKFKNFNVFEKKDVSRAEREICEILNAGGVRETTVLEASTEFIMEAQLDAVITKHKTLEKNVMGVIGPENPIFKATLMGVTPAEAAQHFPSSATTTSLLRHLVNSKDANKLDLRERLLFSCDSAAEIQPNDMIPDDLSDRLFGDIVEENPDIETIQCLEDVTNKDELDDICEEADDEDDVVDFLPADGSNAFGHFLNEPSSRLRLAQTEESLRSRGNSQLQARNVQLATLERDQTYEFSPSSEEEDAKTRRERRQKKKQKAKLKTSSQELPTTPFTNS